MMTKRSKLSLQAIEAAKKTPLPWARGARRAAMIARREDVKLVEVKPRPALRLAAG